MKFLAKYGLVALISMVPALTAHAADQQIEQEMKALKQAVTKRMPSIVDPKVKPTPMKGLYEVMSGGQVMYMTKDARYIFDGDMYDMEAKKNLTEAARGTVRLGALNKLGEENMLVYKPEGKVRHTITVFTDIYCPYCVRLHNEMDQYQKNGVKVRYIFVPFKGKKSVDASVSVWCAKDRNKAMDMAKAGEDIEKKTCDNPVSKHKEMAAILGIRGTPAIMLESGQLMPGYVPAPKLIQQMDNAL